LLREPRIATLVEFFRVVARVVVALFAAVVRALVASRFYEPVALPLYEPVALPLCESVRLPGRSFGEAGPAQLRTRPEMPVRKL